MKDARKSLWLDAWRRFRRDRFAVAGLAIILAYAAAALAAKAGWICSPWEEPVAAGRTGPSGELVARWLGTDLFGRSVLYKAVHSIRVALGVGLVSCLISVPIGVTLGALAGYFGGWVDDLVVWLYSTVSSIPDIMLLLAIAYVLGKGLGSVYIALSATAWIGLARVIRGEFIRHRSREYVLAAEALGVGHRGRIFRHILPNVTHLVIIQVSIQFVYAIKSEVILSFLGIGVEGQPSWGLMIDEAKQELSSGSWWQLSAATGAMFFLVLALNLVGDALRDALDPRMK